MSFSDILSTTGIILTVIFGLWSVFATVRRVKYPGRLTFVREQICGSVVGRFCT